MSKSDDEKYELRLAEIFGEYKSQLRDAMLGMGGAVSEAKGLGKAKYKRFCKAIGLTPDSPMLEEIGKW